MEAWLCPACLAPSRVGHELCTACSAPLVLGGRFVVLEPLAARGSARTLAGVERHGGAPVILKTLSVSGMTDWKQLELFMRGIGVLRGLSHPGIPRHLGDGQLGRGGETIYFWAQERVPGRTLAQGLEEGQRWTEARARALADAVLEILEYLQGYSPPILHRDIKPSNVIERPDGGFSLVDFDLVKDTIDPEGSDTTALGTAGYAPLEQLMGRAVPASDLYGLGATLVALLSRKSPADLLDADARRIELRPHVRVSEGFAGFLERLLEPRVTLRPADAAEARALLRATSAEAPAAGASATRAAIRGASPEATPLDRARSELLHVLQRRASALGPSPALARPAPVEVVAAPSGQGVAVVQTTLVQPHPVPRWMLFARAAIVAGSAVAIPAKGVVLAVLLLALWVVSGFAIRYRVVLPPGRALFRGGLSNTGEPGTYLLRPRMFGAAYSISVAPLHLDWRLAPTRLEQGRHDAWLELEVELWIEPCSDDLGQFRALLNYDLWHEFPRNATKALRGAVLEPLLEHVAAADLLARASGGPVRLEHDRAVELAIAQGLRTLGLELWHVRPTRIALVPRTENLETEDRLWIDERPLPEG